MKVIFAAQPTSPVPRGGVLSVGKFDGVHLGHQQMLRHVSHTAKESGVPSIAVTFDTHPSRTTETLSNLCDWDDKIEKISQCGMDTVVVLPSTATLLNMTPHEFYQRYIVEMFAATRIVEGANFTFGKNRAGNMATLRQLGTEYGVITEEFPAVYIGDELVSSSRIRELLRNGEVRAANTLLGYPYRICGVVCRGDQRGRQMGFPTANLDGVATILPKDGVYNTVASIVVSSDSPSSPSSATPPTSLLAATSIGSNPTFQVSDRRVEVHLLDFSGDLYGQRIAVEFLDYIRDMETFENATDLITSIQNDVRIIRGRGLS